MFLDDFLVRNALAYNAQTSEVSQTSEVFMPAPVTVPYAKASKVCRILEVGVQLIAAPQDNSRRLSQADLRPLLSTRASSGTRA